MSQAATIGVVPPNIAALKLYDKAIPVNLTLVGNNSTNNAGTRAI
ncbi:MAG: hypothetical protein AB8U16_04385 [Rickettsiales endosymbiont of Dermacentor nuttalli]